MSEAEEKVLNVGQYQKTGGFPRCSADKELEYLIKAKYNLIYAVTWEERRVIDSLEQICDLPDVNIAGVQVWDSARGLISSRGYPIAGGEGMTNPELVLDHIAKRAEESKGKIRSAKDSRGPIYVMCDLFRYLEATGLVPEMERKLRSLATTLKRSSITVVITSPELQLPLALEKVVTVIDYPLPGPEQLEVMVSNAKSKLVERKRVSKEDAEATPTENIVRALLGLTLTEAEDAIAKTVIVTNKFDIPSMLDLKRQIIRKGQILDYVYSEDKLDDIGGLQGIKQWIKIRKNSFTDKAKDYGLPPPKGIFMLGVQGSGKSLSAKAIANELEIPLLKLDVGRVFGSLVGESESRMRHALKLAESIAPCVLLVDEIGKALSGSNGSNDGGTTRRVISTMLDWMQEKTSPVFLVACSNEIKDLDPALLRRGRFDELFFVDLPNDEERKVIFSIHLKKAPRKRDPKNFELDKLAAATQGFSGAEIEACILDAMNNAFSDKSREFTTKDILDAIKVCVPLSKVMKKELDELRECARDRMRKASDPLFQHADAADGEDSRFDLFAETTPPVVAPPEKQSAGEDILSMDVDWLK